MGDIREGWGVKIKTELKTAHAAGVLKIAAGSLDDLNARLYRSAGGRGAAMGRWGGSGAGLRCRAGEARPTHVIAKWRWGDREFYLTGREIFPGKNLKEIFWEILLS